MAEGMLSADGGKRDDLSWVMQTDPSLIDDYTIAFERTVPATISLNDPEVLQRVNKNTSGQEVKSEEQLVVKICVKG